MMIVLALVSLAGPPEFVRHTTDGLDKQRPAWSPDGRTLVFARHEAGGTAIWLYGQGPGEAESPRRLTDRKGPEYNADFSPDGEYVLFAGLTLSGTQGNVDVLRVDAEGANPTTVTDDGGKLVHQDWPSWSPDGKKFAFSSTHDGNQEIYTANADGSGVLRLTQSAGHDAHPAWSPNGKTVVFATDRWGGLELASVTPEGEGLRRLTTSPGFDDYPCWSPDGKMLAFVTHRDGDFEVYACRADGSAPVNVSRHPGRDTFPTWKPDGQGITYVSARDGGIDVYTRRFPIDDAR